MWLNNVIPGRASAAPLQIEVFPLLHHILQAFFKDTFDQEGLDRQSRFGCRILNIIKHGLESPQGLAGPILRDFAEKTVLNGIPLGSPGGIVANHDFNPKLIGQLLLHLYLPLPIATAVTATGITEDKQFIFMSKAGPVRILPPLGDGISGESRGVTRCADVHIALVMGQVINAIRGSPADGIRPKIMGINLDGSLAPISSRILEIADQLLLFGIHTDNRVSRGHEKLSNTTDEAELTPSVCMAWGQALPIAE